MDSKGNMISLVLMGIGFILLTAFTFTGTFKIAFEGDGAAAIDQKLRDPTVIWIFLSGLISLLVGLVIYFAVFKGNQNRESLFTILFIFAFASLFLSNIAMMSSLYQVIVSPE